MPLMRRPYSLPLVLILALALLLMIAMIAMIAMLTRSTGVGLTLARS